MGPVGLRVLLLLSSHKYGSCDERRQGQSVPLLIIHRCCDAADRSGSRMLLTWERRARHSRRRCDQRPRSLPLFRFATGVSIPCSSHSYMNLHDVTSLHAAWHDSAVVPFPCPTVWRSRPIMMFATSSSSCERSSRHPDHQHNDVMYALNRAYGTSP